MTTTCMSTRDKTKETFIYYLIPSPQIGYFMSQFNLIRKTRLLTCLYNKYLVTSTFIIIICVSMAHESKVVYQ